MISAATYYKRNISKALKAASRAYKVLLLTGPRKVGKRTLLQELGGEDRRYVTLADGEALRLAKEDPLQFFQAYPTPVYIDEVQKAPNLLMHIARMVKKSRKKGQVWLSSTRKLHLLPEVSRALAGQMVELRLQGLSQKEKQHVAQSSPFMPLAPQRSRRVKITQQEAYEHIVRGANPEVWSDAPPENYYAGYVASYLEQEVREMIQVSNETVFMRFLRSLALRTGQLLNYDSVARDVGVSPPTIKNWVSVLEDSGLVYLLPPYSENVPHRVIKTPKMYFLDTGLCCYLCGIASAEEAQNSPMSGGLFVTYVISEVLKSYWNQGLEPSVYFYRNAYQREISLLIENGGKLWPVEIVQSKVADLHMIRNFSMLDPALCERGALVCLADKLKPLSREVLTIPVGYI